jgi:hypothetical protein
MQLTISPTGRVTGIYDEALNLAGLGRVAIRRASHVEPDPAGRWWADLAPVGGPVLGPFPRRSDALAAERDWLERADLSRLDQPTLFTPETFSWELARSSTRPT